MCGEFFKSTRDSNKVSYIYFFSGQDYRVGTFNNIRLGGGIILIYVVPNHVYIDLSCFHLCCGALKRLKLRSHI